MELHWAFAGRHYPDWADVAAVHARAERIAVGGTLVRTPQGADALALLALHATKHGWSTAEDVVTFTRLARRERDALRDAVAVSAARGLPIPLALALRLAGELCAWTPTADVRAPAMAEAPVPAMARECLGRMCDGAGGWRETHRWTLAWIGGAVARARYWRTALLAPTRRDVEWLRLPAALTRLYPLVRLARLARRPFARAR